MSTEKENNESATRLRGCIIDSRDGRPITEASVEVELSNKEGIHLKPSARTANDGTFEIPLTAAREPNVLDSAEVVVRVRGVEVLRLDPAATSESLRRGFLDIRVESPRAGEPVVSHFLPNDVHPGTLLEIHGSYLDTPYGQVTAWLGNQECLVVDIQPERIIIRVPPEGGDLESLRLQIGAHQITTQTRLRWAWSGDERRYMKYGPPATFSGSPDET